MLSRIGEIHGGTIEETSFPVPFKAGLEYSSPARGCWNIVHTGMLIPEAHQIFVCAYGCLRGVVLTAAEANCLDRYSSICISEENVLNGDMENLMIEGVADILEKLEYEPKAVLLFISCQHFFLAYDQQLVFQTLRERFPQIAFADCYMIPTLRKSGITPDQKMRIQMFSMWKPCERNEKRINIIGSNHPILADSELRSWLGEQGYDIWDLQRCTTFQEYMDMASAGLNIYYEPLAAMGMAELKERLGMEHQYLSCTFDEKELEDQYFVLANLLGIPEPDFSSEKQQARESMARAKAVIGDGAIALDYTFTFRTMNFAKALLDHGFNLKRIYIDGFLPEDEEAFLYIRDHYPEIRILPTNQPEMRFLHGQERDEKVLAIGQKAAYFEGTDHFVNVAESGGLFGYAGMKAIGELMADAWLQKKDRKEIIQKKGFGCESCI